MSFCDTYGGNTYKIEDIPKTESYDELCYILTQCMRLSDYKKLIGNYCGDKANNLLCSWGYKTAQYEIY
jgi:hypothetical protein